MAVPTISSAEVEQSTNAHIIKVTFSEAVNATDTTGVTASINATGSTVTGQQVSDDVIEYSLADPILKGDTVLLSIAVTVNTITSVSTADAFVSVTDQAVTNNSFITYPPLAFLQASKRAQTATLIGAKVTLEACKAAC